MSWIDAWMERLWPTTPAAVYRDLWRVGLEVVGPMGSIQYTPNLSGWRGSRFQVLDFSDGTQSAYIDLGRTPDRVPKSPDRPNPPRGKDAEVEAIVLSHEIGHLLSQRRGYWSERDQVASSNRAKDCCTEEDKEYVIREEERAWDFGRQVLKDLGVTDFSLFCHIRASCLKTYLDMDTVAS